MRKERADAYFTVHPHGRGDGVGLRCWRIKAGRFTPTGVGTAILTIIRITIPIRFTPTGVGTAAEEWFTTYVLTVHPHGRGDGSGMLFDLPAVNGSPPRAWGRRPCCCCSFRWRSVHPHGRGDGGTLTPAGCLCVSVHPHGRGDGESNPSNAPLRLGSPPRAWGRLKYQGFNLELDRFTPTGVGTAKITQIRLFPLDRFTPTGVGTAINNRKYQQLQFGSPPRAWGRR